MNNKRLDIETVDIESYLNKKNVEYDTSGKNISQGWIGVECVFCPDGDQSNHLGINLDKKTISCWRCGKRGTIIDLAMELENCEFNRAIQALIPFTDIKRQLPQSNTDTEQPHNAEHDFNLPKCFCIPNPSHINFLKSRFFDFITLINKYNIQFTGVIGDWKLRIIIPIYYKNKLVSFTTRDVTNSAYSPYIHCPNEKSIIPIKNTLYNFDTVKDTAIVMEGPLDVWRIGDGAVATYGTKYTSYQLKLLSNLKRVFVMYDQDAIEQGKKLAHDISGVVSMVEVIELSQGDPCNLIPTEVGVLRNEIFGRI